MVFTYVGEALSTAHVLALVGLFARMGANMHRQGTALNEALAAVRFTTGIRTLVGVNAIMPLKIRLSIEALKGL